MKGETETGLLLLFVVFFFRALAIVGTTILKHIEITGVNKNDFINLEGSFEAQDKKNRRSLIVKQLKFILLLFC